MRVETTETGDTVINNSMNFADFNHFYVAVAVDDNGKEGLVAWVEHQGERVFINSMIGGSPQDKKRILDSANETAKRTGLKIRVIQFSARNVILEATP